MKNNRNYFYYFIPVILGFVLGFYNPEGKIDFLVKKSAERSVLDYGGWRTNLKLARNDQGMLMRGIVARIGLGANTKEEAIYLSCKKDSDGQSLNSANEYKIIFDEDLPVDAFWSVTLYGADDYLIKNDFNKYAVSSFNDLKVRDDGEIILTLSKNKPQNDANWIPLPKNDQNLTLTLRCYNPQKKMLEELDNVKLPVVKRVIKGQI